MKPRNPHQNYSEKACLPFNNFSKVINSFKHTQNSFMWFFDQIRKIGINYFLNIDACEGMANDYIGWRNLI
jgi:hypothetical protein